MNTSLTRQNKHRAKYIKLFGMSKWEFENQVSLVTALNKSSQWTAQDEIVCLDKSLTIAQKASKLGRTKYAVEHRIKILNRK